MDKKRKTASDGKVNERLEWLMTLLEVETIQVLSLCLGVSKNTLQSVFHSGKMGETTARKIEAEIPGVSAKWLLTGGALRPNLQSAGIRAKKRQCAETGRKPLSGDTTTVKKSESAKEEERATEVKSVMRRKRRVEEKMPALEAFETVVEAPTVPPKDALVFIPAAPTDIEISSMAFVPKLQPIFLSPSQIPQSTVGPTEWFGFPRSCLEQMLDDVSSARVWTVQDQLMHPFITFGDTIILDTSKTEVKDDKIYAFTLGGSINIQICRLKKVSGRYVMQPGNPTISSFDITAEAVQIIGQCVFFGRPLS